MSFIHIMFVTAAGAIGGMMAIGLFYHAVRCYLLRKHWREFAATIIGDDGVQLSDADAILHPGHFRSDDQHDSIPIVDEELSVRLGLPPAPPDDDDDADDGDAETEVGKPAETEVGKPAETEVGKPAVPAAVPAAEPHPRAANTIEDAGLAALTLPKGAPLGASGSADNSLPLDGEDPASDPASTPSEEEYVPAAGPEASALGPISEDGSMVSDRGSMTDAP
jgi:hypothetical protein